VTTKVIAYRMPAVIPADVLVNPTVGLLLSPEILTLKVAAAVLLLHRSTRQIQRQKITHDKLMHTLTRSSATLLLIETAGTASF